MNKLFDDLWKSRVSHRTKLTYVYFLTQSQILNSPGIVSYAIPKVKKNFPMDDMEQNIRLMEEELPVVVDYERHEILFIDGTIDLAASTKRDVSKAMTAVGKLEGSVLAICWAYELCCWISEHDYKKKDELIATVGGLPFPLTHLLSLNLESGIDYNPTVAEVSNFFVATKFLRKTSRLRSLDMVMSRHIQQLTSTETGELLSRNDLLEKLISPSELDLQPRKQIVQCIKEFAQMVAQRSPEVVLDFEQSSNSQQCLEKPKKKKALNPQQDSAGTNQERTNTDHPQDFDRGSILSLSGEPKITAKNYLESFDLLYEQKTGKKYARTSWPRDIAIVKNIMAAIPLEDFTARAQAFFDDEWINRVAAFQFKTFVNRINNYRGIDSSKPQDEPTSDYWKIVEKARA